MNDPDFTPAQIAWAAFITLFAVCLLATWAGYLYAHFFLL